VPVPCSQERETIAQEDQSTNFSLLRMLLGDRTFPRVSPSITNTVSGSVGFVLLRGFVP